MVYGTFNLGLFVVLTVISARHVGPAIGFGLFAMLSIVRLRSEPIGNAKLAYFFCALVLALVNGLPVDDEPLIVGLNVLVLLTLTLTRAGLGVDVVGLGADALIHAGATEYDAIVLDAMLPDLDGLDVCRRLREDRVWSPVLMLTARDRVPDRVDGLDAGADDYLAKPFAFDELLARLRALARRGPVERPPMLQVDDLRLDPAGHRVWRGDTPLELSAKELALLEIFMRSPGQALSHFTLLEHAWEGEYENRSNVVDVFVRMLRDKIGRPFGRASLQTVRGVGYRLCDDA